MKEAIDFSALNWVRHELGETLKQGRQFLEEYAEAGGDVASLHQCMACLHEARGPLRMVELQGADLLAMEMEEVVNDLIHGRIARPEAAQEVLMQAFLQLPDYLSRLKSGQPDVPDILLPSINELRAARESEPLEQSALFHPDPDVPMPYTAFPVDRDTPVEDVQGIAKARRHHFQAGLLEWYRGVTGDAGLQRMHEVLAQLQRSSAYEQTARLWWLAAGLVEALQNRCVEVTGYTRQLLGQVDRQIKQLIDSGESVFSSLVPEVLLRDLLYCLSKAADTPGRVGEIRQTYGMDSLSGGAARDAASGSVAGCSAELLGSVSAAAMDELEEVGELLESFLGSGMQDMARLVGVRERLHALANSVAMTGLEATSSKLAGNARRVADMVEQGQDCNESGLMAVADDMVAVHSALAALRDGHVSGGREECGEQEFNEGLDAVMREVVSNMSTVKEQINDYLKHPDNPELLHEVPQLLNQVSGSLRLADQEEAAGLVNGIRECIAHGLSGGGGMPEGERLDTLADAICSVELYVEELSVDRLYGEMVLDVARKSMAKLGYTCAPASETATGALPVAESPGEGEEELPPAVGQAVPDSGGLPPEAVNVIGTGQEDKPVAESVAPEPLISALQVIGEDADGEIIDIFIEEAAEVMAELNTRILQLQSSPGEAETLQEIRRGFHTLKGSGRMVGALAIGEFAWLLERLLNRVIDGSLSLHEDILALLGEVTGPLSELIAQVSEGTLPSADVDAIAARASVLAEGGGTAGVPGPVAEAAADIAGTPGMPEPAVPAASLEPLQPAGGDGHTCLDEYPVLAEDADPEIVDIFLEEAGEAIAGIRELVPGWCGNPQIGDTLETLCRSFHTLKGSGRMAGAMRIGEFAWVLENLLNRVADGSVAITGDLIDLLRGIGEPLDELLLQVNNGPAPRSDITARVMAAERLVRGEPAGLPAGDDGGAGMDTAAAIGSSVEPVPVQVEGTDAMPVTEEDDDAILLEIFTREGVEHLEAIADFVDACDHEGGSRPVTASLYRALHTLSGASESAGLPHISRLAGDLYTHIGSLEEADLPVTAADLDVLRACGLAMAEMVGRLPERDFDADRLDALQAEIGKLSPAVERILPAGEDVAGPAAAQAEMATAMPEEAVVMAGPAAVQPETATGESFADIDMDLLEIFIEEAGEILDSSANTLREWSEEPGQAGLLDEFQRQLHTLKGGARMVGIAAIGNLSHSVESLLTRVVDGHVETSARLFDLLQDAHDALAAMLEQVRENCMPQAVTPLEAKLDRMGYADEAESEVAQNPVEPAAGEPVAEDVPGIGVTEALPPELPVEDVPPVQPEMEAGTQPQEETPPPAEPAMAMPAATEDGVQPQPDTAATDSMTMPRPLDSPAEAAQEGEVMPRRQERRRQSRVRSEQVRVQSGLLDSLVNYAGEINIYRSRLEQQLSMYRFNLAELDQTISRLRDQLRQMEIETETQILFRYEQDANDRNHDFDPLEMDRYSNIQQLSRSLLESISDLDSIQEMLENTTRESETLLLQQSRVSTDLQEGLLHTRMIPFASLVPRLRRIVRQSAGELGKKVDLKLEGADGEMDRTVIERIIAPLEHMLRNAVAHGIEKSRVRRKAGKPAVGTILIEFHREGPEIVLKISDDGRGMDLEAIRTRAIERGLMAEDAGLPDSEVMQFILQTGFSTASEVTQIAGRGVGMDVVNSEVKQLGGSLHLDSRTGVGSVFTVRLPYTLAINQALLVRAGEDNFCIPLGGVESVVRIGMDELGKCREAEQPVYEYAGNQYQLKHLGRLLRTGESDTESESGRVPLLLVRVGETRIALQVDALIGIREIVVKPLGMQLSSVTGVSGATILGDGRVVMILDLPAIVRMSGKRDRAPDEQGSQARDRLLVMVVDDSITVRKVTTRLLERQGFEVITAKDGIDAMSTMQDRLPDMMLLDIEMPRMDGFELASHMRNDQRLRHIPITMITSRTGDKHRERAKQIGIDHYLGKPYQEHELLATINHLIGMPGDVQAAG